MEISENNRYATEHWEKELERKVCPQQHGSTGRRLAQSPGLS